MKKKIKYKLLKAYSNLIRRILGPYTIGCIVKMGDYSLVVNHTDMSIGRQLRNHGSYSETELERLKTFINNDSNVLVLGAHVGSLLIPLSKFSKAIVAYEANPETYELLNLSVGLNKIENITIHNQAVGEEVGQIEFVGSRVFSGGAKRLPKKNLGKYLWDKPELHKVDLVPLDGVTLFADSDIDLVVMDIEGSEYFALKGMQKTMSKVQRMVMEFIPHHIKNISNSTVEELVSLVEPHFDFFKMSFSDDVKSTKEVANTFHEMVSNNIGDEGIIFWKTSAEMPFKRMAK